MDSLTDQWNGEQSSENVQSRHQLKLKKNDEWNQKTEWHKVVVTKGTRLHVSGRLIYGEHMYQKGVKRQTTSIVCEDMIFFVAKEVTLVDDL